MVTIETIGVFVNFLVALGTISLAIISYISIKIVRRQTNLISSQSNFLRLQQIPLLRVEDLKFDGNEVSLRITNIGNGIAKGIGVKSEFYMVERELVDPPDEKTKEKKLKELGIPKKKLQAAIKKFGKEIWYRFKYVPPIELFIEESEQNEFLGIFPKEINKAYPINYITYLKEEENKVPFLKIGNSIVFKCTPKFGLRVGEHYLSGQKFPKYEEALSYDNLLDLCKKNGIKFIGLNFNLVYKDLANEIQMPEELWDCVAIINSHKTLEDAVKENNKIILYPQGQLEIEKKIGGEFEYSYNDPNCVESIEQMYKNFFKKIKRYKRNYNSL